MEVNYINIIKNQITNNRFQTKEDLIKYINQLKENGMLPNLEDEEIKQILDFYDSQHTKEQIPLDMTNYKNVKLEDQDLIISQKAEQILKTNSQEDFVDEFKNTQNEIIANNKDNNINADDVFAKMLNQEKEELTLITISEALTRDDIEIEILNKLKYFITNQHTDPRIYKINIETGMLYNTETKEVYEVRKNESTNQYEIYKGGEKIYGNATDNKETQPVEHEKDEEQQGYEERIEKQNVKVKKLEKPPFINNAAFTKVGFLIINIVTFSIITLMIMLLNK